MTETAFDLGRSTASSSGCREVENIVVESHSRCEVRNECYDSERYEVISLNQ